MLNQPEGTDAEDYTQWHTWTDMKDTGSGWSGKPREHFSNAHDGGGRYQQGVTVTCRPSARAASP